MVNFSFVKMIFNYKKSECTYIFIYLNAVTSNSIFTPHPVTLEENNKHIISYHKFLNIKHNNLHYPYTVMISKFYQNLLKFRSITVGCNTDNTHFNKLFLNILTQTYELSVKKDNNRWI